MNKKRIAWLLAAVCAFGAFGCEKPPVRERQALVSYRELGLDTVEEAYVDTPFYSSNEDAVTYTANALWDQFGLASNGDVAKLGLNSSWLYWDTAKSVWYAGSLKDKIRSTLKNYPQRKDGFLWSWASSETWGGAGYNNNDPTYTPVYHFDQIFNYISAVREVCVWENSVAFLSERDTDTARTEFEVNGIEYRYEDASEGKTVLEKAELALDYALNELNGKSGLIVIDNGMNTGEYGSASSNYWDNLCFGYQDAYEGALFLGAVSGMANLYRMTGDSAKESEMQSLLSAARAAYDETYWDNAKGRYISSVSASGKKMDFGLTFLNTEALYYGAGDQKKADLIFSWIDGEREIAGDTLTGTDILDRWNIAPVSNTVSIESQKEMNAEGSRYITWWHAPSSINVFTNSAYGLHCENGGAIFYTAYFELMSRIRYGKTDSALQRMITIGKEYAEDRLIRDPANTFGFKWILGVIGEFPESGLVPVTYLRGFMGVNAMADGLYILPNLPEEYADMGARQVSYGGKTYDIRIVRDQSITMQSTDDHTSEFTLVFSDFAGKGSYTATVTDASGKTETIAARKRADGTFAVDLSASGGCTIRVS